MKRQHAEAFLRRAHERACALVHEEAARLRQYADEAERVLDGAGSPGNIAACAARLEAAREKAYALSESAMALGIKLSTTR